MKTIPFDKLAKKFVELRLKYLQGKLSPMENEKNGKVGMTSSANFPLDILSTLCHHSHTYETNKIKTSSRSP